MVVALVSGCDERVAAVAAALQETGARVVVSDDPARLAQVAGSLEPASLSCYVQLPVRVDVTGATVVGRVRTFLRNGLLARFDAAEAVLPALRDDATVVLVTGNTPAQGANLPDDFAARHALLDVLAHAVRADKSPGKVRVRTMGPEAAPADIAAVGLRGEPARPRVEPVADDRDLSYQDWRVEVMGLATVQV